MSLFISEGGARRAAMAAIRSRLAWAYEIKPVTRRCNGWQIERGFRVLLLNASGLPTGTL